MATWLYGHWMAHESPFRIYGSMHVRHDVNDEQVEHGAIHFTHFVDYL